MTCFLNILNKVLGANKTKVPKQYSQNQLRPPMTERGKP